jgi:hypothetical protein
MCGKGSPSNVGAAACYIEALLSEDLCLKRRRRKQELGAASCCLAAVDAEG